MKKFKRCPKPLSWYIAVVISFPLLLCLISCKRTQPQAAPVTRANPKAKRWLGDFGRVEGTQYLSAEIRSRPYESGSFLESEFKTGKLHNYAFFDTISESTERLLPTNDYVIISTWRYPELKEGEKTGLPVKWFLYSLVKRDTNGDKDMTSEDKQTLALSDFNGKNYVEVLADVEGIFGQSQRDSETLIIFYNQAARKYDAVVDLPHKKLLTTKELPSLGDDVQQ